MEYGLLLVEDVDCLALVVILLRSFKHRAIDVLVLRLHMPEDDVGCARAI